MVNHENKDKKKQDDLSSPSDDLRDIKKIVIFGEIKEDMAKDIAKDIMILTEKLSKKKHKKDKKITIYISSPGGDVYSGLEIIGAIKEAQRKGIECIGIVNSHAESMGFFILQFCSLRLMGMGAFLMIHGPTYTFCGDSKSLESEKLLSNHIQNYLAREMSYRCPCFTENWWRDTLSDNRNLYYTPDMALDKNLVDNIIE